MGNKHLCIILILLQHKLQYRSIFVHCLQRRNTSVSNPFTVSQHIQNSCFAVFCRLFSSKRSIFVILKKKKKKQTVPLPVQRKKKKKKKIPFCSNSNGRVKLFYELSVSITGLLICGCCSFWAPWDEVSVGVEGKQYGRVELRQLIDCMKINHQLF